MSSSGQSDAEHTEFAAAARLHHIWQLAEATFEDSGKAARWLRRPLMVLGKKAPIELVVTEEGGRLVENILARIAWGVAP